MTELFVDDGLDFILDNVPDSIRFVEIGGKQFDCAGVDGPRPWDRVEEWDRREWHPRLMIYVGMPPERRSGIGAFNLFREQIGKPRVDKVESRWATTSSKSHWKERAEAFDAWQRETSVLSKRRFNAIGDAESRQRILEFSQRMEKAVVESIDALEAMFRVRRTERVTSRWTKEQLAEVAANTAVWIGQPRETTVTLRPTVNFGEVLGAPLKMYNTARILRGLPPVEETIASASAAVQVNIDTGMVPSYEHEVIVGELSAARRRIVELEEERDELLRRIESIDG
jgi:hypothetical protein